VFRNPLRFLISPQEQGIHLFREGGMMFRNNIKSVQHSLEIAVVRSLLVIQKTLRETGQSTVTLQHSHPADFGSLELGEMFLKHSSSLSGTGLILAPKGSDEGRGWPENPSALSLDLPWKKLSLTS